MLEQLAMDKSKKPKTVLSTLSATHRDMPETEDGGRGVHSSTFQLNLSSFGHKIHPEYPLLCPDTS